MSSTLSAAEDCCLLLQLTARLQTVARQKYPHEFTNTEGIDTVTTQPACNGQSILEFPILNNGKTLSGGPGVQIDVGTERILFTVDAQGNTVYCGIVTHNSDTKVMSKDGKLLLPFTDCIPTVAGNP